MKKAGISTISFFNVFITTILAALFFYEYFAATNAKDYPFGAEGPLPEYYRSRESYLTNVSNYGFLFIGLLVVSIGALLQNMRVMGLCIFLTIITLIVWIFVEGKESGSLASQYNHSRGYYAMPHDSTIGVPNFVFMFIWLLIILFLLRLAWEFRDKIFVRNDEGRPATSKKKKF